MCLQWSTGSAHHALKPVVNCSQENQCYNLKEVNFWVDSITVFCWIKSKDTWSTLVRNKALEIAKFENINWHYVPTKKYSNNLGSRGISSQEKITKSWLYRPELRSDETEWPCQNRINIIARNNASNNVKGNKKKRATWKNNSKKQNFIKCFNRKVILREISPAHCFHQIFHWRCFLTEFSILALGKNWNLGNEKARNNISKISDISEFSICHFFILLISFILIMSLKSAYFTFAITFFKYSSTVSSTK